MEESATRIVAKVVVDVPTRAVDRLFDYLVPDSFQDRIAPGWRVFVQFGNQFCVGYVMAVQRLGADSRLKPILSLIGDEPVFTQELVDLVVWMHERYVCTYLEGILTIVPSAFRAHQVHHLAAGSKPDHDATVEQLRIWQAAAKRPRSVNQLIKQFGSTVLLEVEQMRSRGWLKEVQSMRDETRAKTISVLEAVVDEQRLFIEEEARQKRAPKQARLLQLLRSEGNVRLGEHQIPPSDQAVQSLMRAGLVRVVELETYRRPTDVAVAQETQERTLTSFQQRSLQTIVEARDDLDVTSVLLFGVTGSGKTEVYLRAIADTLQQHSGAIVLVPEISLTPQMVGRFTEVFGRVVAVLHSGLSDGERRDEWLRIRRGEAKIVIGARSAVFAPIENVRLVIVDEEHEPSYKQDENPRYDAREIARWRAERSHGVVVYGSATPSLIAMMEVERGSSRLASLPFRVHGRPLPPVEIVDMREELRSGNRALFSRALSEGLESTLSAGAQAVLFLNRRGFASFVLCRGCGDTLLCPHCDISLTLHKGRSGDYLECHYCGFHSDVPEVCPSCKEDALRPFGIGTQQVEQFIHEQWPSWRVLRMDVDTTRRKGSHQKVIQSFLNHEADILLGTQMVAKGLDFPDVGFVGVVTADTMLSIPDYRAAERTFHLLTQVSGRAGRADVPGRTVIQTYQPEHYSIVSAAGHDYHGFYKRELDLRKAFDYPPFFELAVFVATHAVEEYARGAAMRFERELKRTVSGDTCKVLSAVPAGVKRVEDRFRYQVVVKYKEWNEVQKSLVQAYHLVSGKMRQLRGTCTLDVNAGRI